MADVWPGEPAVDENGLEILGRDECLRLLVSVAIGRIGVSYDALPAILPVNFVLDDDRVVLRTTSGSKLSAALAGAVVAFEADGFDPMAHTGWSVLVRGAAAVLEGADADRAEQLPLQPWAGPAADHFVAVPLELVSGRRAGASFARPPIGGR